MLEWINLPQRAGARRIPIVNFEGLRSAAVLSYATVAFGVLSGLLYTPWMIRTIGTGDFAVYSLVLSVVSLIALDLGLGSATSRFLTLFKAKGDDLGERRFLTVIIKAFILLTVVLSLALALVYLYAPRIYSGLGADEVEQLRSVLAIFGLYSVMVFPFRPLDGILLANEKFVQLKLLDLAQKVLTLALMVLALWLGYGLYGVVAGNVVGGLVTTLFKLNAAMRSTEIRPDWRVTSRSDLRSLLGFTVWTTLISISQRLIINIQPSIIAGISGSHQVALFAIAVTVQGYVSAIASGINGLLLPRVTRLTVAGEAARGQIQGLLERVGRLQLFLLGSIAAGFLLHGQQFMRLWVGPLADSFRVAAILMIPAVVTATLHVAETALVASGRIRNVALASSVASALSLPPSLALVNLWGALGAAYAVFFGSMVGMVAYMIYVYQKQLGLHMGRFFIAVYLRTLPWLIAATLLSGLAGSMLPGDGWVSFVLRAVIFLAIDVAVLFTFVLSPEERRYFRRSR